MNQLITKGTLKSGELFYMRKLHMEDIAEISRLQEVVVHDLHDLDLLVTLSEAELHYLLSGGGTYLGVFIKNRLIACRAFLIPDKNDTEHLGYDAFIQKEAFSEIIYSEISMVDPKYRGNRLQTYIGEQLFKLFQKTDYKYVLATVAPTNIPSLKDKFALGMKIVAIKEKYGGKLRFILFRHLQAASEPPIVDKIIVACDDVISQVELLNSGYVGVELLGDGKIRYEKSGK